jgi:predicted RNase H-like HicB family nuclease
MDRLINSKNQKSTQTFTKKHSTRIMQAEKYITLLVEFYLDKDGRWVAECKELDLSTYSDSLDGVAEEMREATELYLNTLEDVGERARFFREHNIKTFTTPKQKRTVTIRPDVYVRSFIHQLQPMGAS